MRYAGDRYQFSTEAPSALVTEVELGGEVLGYATFDADSHWEYEHTHFVAVPRDLSDWDIDTSEEDGVSLFKNGEIVFDAAKGHLISAQDMVPAMGLRYIGEIPGIEITDYFDYDDEIGIYVLLGD